MPNSTDEKISSPLTPTKDLAVTNLEGIAFSITKRAETAQRYVVAVAGPPGAGKSFLSAELVKRLSPEMSIVVPMDGFHFDNSHLDQLGLRRYKGSPETFDYRGFEALLRRIRQNESDIAFPVFDREMDVTRASATLIDRRLKFVLVEGNYLLLDESPWSGLTDCFDCKIFLDVPKNELNKRLLERWTKLGYSEQEAEAKVATNDMPNVERVLSHRSPADLLLKWEPSL